VATDALIPGRATAEGTRRFAARFAGLPGHFRVPDRLALSSIGLGTRGGEAGGADDVAYRGAVLRALELGCNVFDSSIAYRSMTSERALGAALRRAFARGLAARDEVFAISKCGYLSIDPASPLVLRDPRRYLSATYVDSGLVDPDEAVNGVHVLSPRFVRDQLRRSRENLGLATLDLYCLDDPELQLLAHGPDAFRARLRAVIAELEEAVRAGEIASWGISSWSGFITPHTEKGHLSISELLELALDVGGADHHLRGFALPYGAGVTQALSVDSQFVPGGTAGVLEALRDTGSAVFAAAPLARGRAVRGLPRFVAEHLPGLASDAARALQLARSTPGVSSALVGMRDLSHVEQNLGIARVAPASAQAVEALYRAARAAAGAD
jgi:aryl-alcohol dehydrogenase-like predicted oxidoreductase